MRALAAAPLLLAAGCSLGDQSGLFPCKTNSDCLEGRVCVEGFCEPRVSGPPRITAVRSSPDPAKDGDAVTVTIEADQRLAGCTARSGGQAATCEAPVGKSCACTLIVTSVLAEGNAVIEVQVNAENGQASGSGSVQVDRTAPTVDRSLLRILRRPVGQEDAVSVAAAAWADAGGVAYAARRVARLRFWNAQSGGRLLAEIEPPAEGSREVDLPGSDGASAEAFAPKQVWASALDMAGNESARSEIAAGRDDVAPVANTAKLTMHRRDLTQRDGIEGVAGAFTDASALVAANVYGPGLLATTVPGADGSFAEVQVGDGDSSYPSLWVSAVDKCGNKGSGVEAPGADRTGPTVNGSKVTIVRRGIGQVDGIAGQAGALTDSSALRTVRIYDGIYNFSRLLASGPVNPDGSFAELPVGDASTSYAQLWVTGLDKAWNESARTEALVGKDVTGPAGDGSRITIVRRGFSELDGVLGAPGAFSDASSALAAVRIYDSASGGNLLGATEPAQDGSFPEIKVGTETSSFGRLWAEAVDKSRNVGPRVEALLGRSQYGPLRQGGPIVIVRRGLTEQDGVYGAPGAFSHPYPFRVNVYPYGGGGGLLGTAEAGTDGSFPEVKIGTSTSSYNTPAVQAVDKGGLGSSRYDATVGRDQGGPSADGSRISIVRRGLTEQDGVVGAAGAFADDASAIAIVNLYSAAAGGAFLGSTSAGSNGGFSEIKIGTATSSHGRVWAAALDKCGNLSPRAVAQIGEDTDPPVVDGARVLFFDRASPAEDGASAGADAMTDAQSAVREVRLFAQAAGGSPLGDAIIPLAGGFAEQSVGDTMLDRVYLEAIDKAGNAARTPSRQVRTVVDLAGGTASRAEIYSFAADRDPRQAWPGLGPSIVAAATADGASGGAAADGSRVSFSASAETASATPGWTQLASGPWAAPIAYDAHRDRMVLFGGANTNQTWEFNGSAWSQVTPVNVPPSRSGHALAYDTARSKVVLFAGQAPPTTVLGDTWEYDGASWSKVTTPTAPLPRPSPSLGFDGAAGKVVLFAGYYGYYNDLWYFDGRWSAPPVTSAPGGRSDHPIAYDAGRGRLVVFGGYAGALNGNAGMGDMWEWDGSSWASLTPQSSPPNRYAHAMAYDPSRGKVVLFGGQRQVGTLVDGGYRSDVENFDDTWEYDGTNWTQVFPAQKPPAMSQFFWWSGMAYDSVRSRLILYGGGFSESGQTWAYSGKTPHARTAAQLIGLVSDGSSASSLSVTYVGAGRGAGGAGVELLVWRWPTGSWVSLGTHSAADTDSAQARTITATPPGPASDYLRHGRVWFLAAPTSASSTPPGTTTSELFTDYVQISATYLLP